MRGLPAINFAMLSLLALSGIALARSVQTKLFTVFLVPLFALGVFLQKMSGRGWSMKDWGSPLRPALVWSIWFTGALADGLKRLPLLARQASVGLLLIVVCRAQLGGCRLTLIINITTIRSWAAPAGQRR